MKTTNLRRRLQALEKPVRGGGPIFLFMPNGDRIAIHGDERRLLSLAMRDERTPEIELIAQSVSSVEPGGGQMIDLARAMLNSPTEMSERGVEAEHE